MEIMIVYGHLLILLLVALKMGLNDFVFLHNYIQFYTVIQKKCFEKIFVGI